MAGRSLHTWVVAAAVLVAAPAALAAASYTAGISGLQQVRDSPTPVVLTTNLDPTQGGHLDGVAVADSPLAAKLTTYDPARGFGTGFSTTANADVLATFDDIVVTGPGTAPVPVTLHLPFHAVFFQDWSFLDFDGGSRDVSHVNQTADFSAAFFSLFGGSPSAEFVLSGLDDESETATVGGLGQNGGTVQLTRDAGNPLDADGFLDLVSRFEFPIETAPGVTPPGAGFAVHDAVALRGEIVLPGMAPLDVPLSLQISLSIVSSAFGGFALDALGTANALHTFGIRQGGPVFDLPEGYTASSAELGIVDNLPEPGGSALSVVALGALAAVRRWRSSGPR